MPPQQGVGLDEVERVSPGAADTLRLTTMSCCRSKAFSAISADRLLAESRTAPAAAVVAERAGSMTHLTVLQRATGTTDDNVLRDGDGASQHDVLLSPGSLGSE
jgi:hypothetical protein